MLRVCALVVLVSTSMVAAEQAGAADGRQSGLRLGLGIGGALIDFDRGFTEADVAPSVFAAYALNRYLSVEASYVDGGSPQDGSVTVAHSEAAAMAVGSLPLIGDTWSVSARAGFVAWSWKSLGIANDGTDFAYGVGTSLDLERIQFQLIGDTADIGTARIIHVSMRGMWKF